MTHNNNKHHRKVYLTNRFILTGKNNLIEAHSLNKVLHFLSSTLGGYFARCIFSLTRDFQWSDHNELWNQCSKRNYQLKAMILIQEKKINIGFPFFLHLNTKKINY